MSTSNKMLDLIGRILLAIIFVLAGYNKIGGYAGTQQYMDSMGVPGMLLPLVILLELGAGLAIAIGWKTKFMSFALGAFCIAAAVIFHRDFADKTHMIMFLKDLAIAGGFFVLTVHGAGPLSIDHKLANR